MAGLSVSKQPARPVQEATQFLGPVKRLTVYYGPKTAYSPLPFKNDIPPASQMWKYLHMSHTHLFALQHAFILVTAIISSS
jgi:hypothetical protein